ncbi:hypothetical protein [Bacillus cereus]|uniref:hypothetical protein n=1 Tax=Bacillus cereus TaxID=1396 RepID=UPI001124FEFE|nr:hypothetical protein [Bacillus cereus]
MITTLINLIFSVLIIFVSPFVFYFWIVKVSEQGEPVKPFVIIGLLTYTPLFCICLQYLIRHFELT